jgi:hypothetical protein
MLNLISNALKLGAACVVAPPLRRPSIFLWKIRVVNELGQHRAHTSNTSSNSIGG